MNARRFVLALLVALAVAVAVDNMMRPLANPDEGRYSEIAREMAESGNWVTPRLNGFKYFEKPPLQYWASAASFKLFGVSEFTARIYVTLCGLFTIACAAFTASRLASREAALYTVAVLISSPFFTALGGIVTLDMGLTAWLTLGVCAFLLAQHAAFDAGARRRWMLVAWAGMALAVLSKGLVGIVFPAAAIFLHCLIHRDWRLLRTLEWSRGLALFLVIAGPWFILVSRDNPEFLRFFFIHEHFERFLTPSHRRVQAWWYFWPLLFVGFLPWMFTLVPAAHGAWHADRATGAFPWRRFAIVWTLLIPVFFSLSSSKLPAYILPAFPIFAVLVGEWLEKAASRPLAWYFAPVAILLLVAIVLAWNAPARTESLWMRELYLAARPWFAGGFALLATALLASAWLARRGRKAAALAVVVGVSLAFVDCIEDGFEEMSPRHSGEVIAEKMKARLAPETRLYTVRYYDQTLPFYIGRTITLVDYVDEFKLGQSVEPGRALPDVAAFLEDWQRPGGAMAIIQPGLFEELSSRGIPMDLLHHDERRVLVAKP